MIKFFRNIFMLVIVIVGGYFLYDFFTKDYGPSQSRDFYKSRSLNIESEVEGDGQAIVAKPVKDLEIKVEANDLELAKLMIDLKQLQEAGRACEAELNELLPKDAMIDPESKFFENKEIAITTLSRLVGVSTSRMQSLHVLNKFGEYLKKKESIDAEKFNSFLTNILVCRKINISMYLETILEASEKGSWDLESKVLIKKTLLDSIVESLREDILPDNLLYNLNILRILGAGVAQDNTYYAEIDSIYTRLADFEDKFFDENDNGKIYSPIQKYDDYLNELNYITDEIKYLIQRRFDQS